MTLDEFLQKLERTPRDWFIKKVIGPGDFEYFAIRRRHQNNWRQFECPITALVAAEQTMATTVSRQLNLNEDLTCDIMHAADEDINHNEGLRMLLLKACGIQNSPELRAHQQAYENYLQTISGCDEPGDGSEP